MLNAMGVANAVNPALAMLARKSGLCVAPRSSAMPSAGFDCAAFRALLMGAGTKGVPPENSTACGASNKGHGA